MGHGWRRMASWAVAFVLLSSQASHAIESLLQEFTFDAQAVSPSCNDALTCLFHSTNVTAETAQESLNRFVVRFGLNVNADDTFFGPGQVEDGVARFTTNFTIGPGNYDLTITVRRAGALRRSADEAFCRGAGILADMGAPTFTINGVADGRLSEFFFPGASIFNGEGNADAAVPDAVQSQVILFRGRTLPDQFSLTFEMAASMFSDSCEMSARLGAPNLSTLVCDSCGYPGTPARTLEQDGLFVEVNIENKCGDGATQFPEQCDLGNLNGEPDNCCDFDCRFKQQGRICRSAAGECDQAESCTGSDPGCPIDVNRPEGSACTPDSDPCTTDTCNAGGQCIHTTVPPPCPGLCGNHRIDPGEDCDGGPAPDPFDEGCCGSNCKFRPQGEVCNPASGSCDPADTCSGTAQFCLDRYAPVGTSCPDEGDACTDDKCNELGQCGHTPNPELCPGRCGNGEVESGEDCDLGKLENGAPTNCCGSNCKYRPDNSSCTDQLFCNGGERCTAGVCGGSAGSPCNRSCSICDEANNVCDTSGCPMENPNLPAQPTRELLIAEIFDGDGDRYDTSAGGRVRGTLDLDANADLRFTGADLARLPRCADDAVLIGRVCIDQYEASVYSDPPGSETHGTQYGVTADDYPCSDDGRDCHQRIFAKSIRGMMPAVYVTWFQAQQACANVGKRLLTNAEWQMAVAGTPDTDEGDNRLTACYDNSEVATVAAGSRSACVSKWGVYDMAGNAWEWVAEWMPRSTTCPGWGTFSDDSMCLAGEGDAPAPAALMRGGGFGSVLPGPFAIRGDFPPTYSASDRIGFRCARAPF